MFYTQIQIAAPVLPVEFHYTKHNVSVNFANDKCLSKRRLRRLASVEGFVLAFPCSNFNVTLLFLPLCIVCKN